VYKQNGDLDLAIADYDKIIRMNPQAAGGYFYRGLVHWQNGSLSKSFSDFDQSGRLNPKSAYAALWRELLARRSEQPSRLAEAATQLDMTKWPAPIVNLFLGASAPEQVLSAADDPDQRRKKPQVCEANFYSAEFALQRGSREDAQRLFEMAAAECPKSFIEGPASNVELKALTKNP
jgi:lipoprotein NlpI